MYLVWGLLFSLQPPFYPREAEAKGATPSQVQVTSNKNQLVLFLDINNTSFQYGFVFGTVHLAAFVSAPIFANYGYMIR